MKKGKEQKPHIGIYGKRNIGKSSIINKLAGQNIAIISEVPGTTTDPVRKAFEITGFGPVILIDTAGIDDVGDLGLLRIEKTFESIKHIDLAILVISDNSFDEFEEKLIAEFKKFDCPFFVIHNKSDITKLLPALKSELKEKYFADSLEFSTKEETDINIIVQEIIKTIPESTIKVNSLLGDLISYGDIVLLITPIDIEAPAGRMILPQVQTIRDILDNDAVAIVLKEKEVDAFLRKTGIKPALAITDSQIFKKADASIPASIPLTGFSIVLARLKGNFDEFLRGTPKISELKSGDKILILESCSHHVSCDDIGRVKIPRWLTNFTGKDLTYEIISGLDKIENQITDYALVVQCGGCMITNKQLQNRLKQAIDAGVPVTNYGMTIAYVQGIYNRAIAPFVKNSEANSIDYL